MNEFQKRSMQRDPRNSALSGFFRAVLAVSDNWMAKRCKLHSNLILQSGHERDSHQRSCPQRAFDRIPELGAGRFAIAFRAQFLMHSFLAKIVDERSFFWAEMPANHGQILPHRRVRKKLPDQRFPVGHGFGEQQNSGGKTIDTMYDQCALPAWLKRMQQKRQCGWRIRTWRRHGQKSGGLVDCYKGIVFIDNGKLARETRLGPMRA